MTRPRLGFVSPVFLFPADAGGKIRTTNILRGLKGGHFETTLVSPATPAQCAEWRGALDGICDHFVHWPPTPPRPRWRRAPDLLGRLPVNVAADRSTRGEQAVERLVRSGQVDAIVFDFVHAAVLAPQSMAAASICFTHNVEAQIFDRHAENADGAALRWLWRSQARKMKAFESRALSAFDKVIAVSAQDARFFEREYGLGDVEAIPTGVDLDYFTYRAPAPVVERAPTVVFTGSMDWDANADGMLWFLESVWPLVRARLPHARLRVVGRNPPDRLRAVAGHDVELTGRVDDVRPYVRGADVFVIPLLVGGGTRIKAFEAMAMGCPVVSTTVGIEGLEVEPGQHYLRADAPQPMADDIVELLENVARRTVLAEAARTLVEARFGHRQAAAAFEDICRRALARYAAGRVSPVYLPAAARLERKET